MADDADYASDRELKETAYLIKTCVAETKVDVDLGCGSCMGISHRVAKETCGDFTACLKDWQKVDLLKKIGGVR